MKTKVLLLLAILFVYSFTSINTETKEYNVDTDFTLVIKGTSNVHDWESSIEELTGRIIVEQEGEQFNIEECNIRIPVKSIKSKKGSIMNKKTWKALDEKNHPKIEYSLSGFNIMNADKRAFTAKSTGELSVAGKTIVMEMMISGKFLADDRIEIRGSKNLKMTDFNIDPPTALLGTMKTGDDITIEFQIMLKAD